MSVPAIYWQVRSDVPLEYSAMLREMFLAYRLLEDHGQLKVCVLCVLYVLCVHWRKLGIQLQQPSVPQSAINIMTRHCLMHLRHTAANKLLNNTDVEHFATLSLATASS